MFTFYWLYKRDNSWLAVFKTDGKFLIAKNGEDLKEILSSVHYLVSYDNYKESDKFIAKIISDGKSSFLQKTLSIDLKQENGKCTIEEIGYYSGLDMVSQNVEEFCKKRIAICEKIFDEQEEYLETKFEIVKEFGLPARSIMKTRANLAAEILQAKKEPKRANVLIYSYDKRLPKAEMPEKLLKFYDSVRKKYQDTLEEKLKIEKFRMTLAGLTHIYGFGGLHAAKEKYRGEGTFLLIDISQFFPSVILNNNFLSHAIKNPDKFADLYQKKVDTGKLSYKVLINAVNGSMNNPYSSMYDPQKFFSVTVSGQLIITHLILVLEKFIEELIQTNTDGILVKINPELEGLIGEIVQLWCQHFNLSVKITKFKKIYQKNVNDYVFEKEDGMQYRKGIFGEPHYKSNNLPVVTGGIYQAVVNGVKPQSYVIDRFKNGNINEFYFVGKLQGDFDSIQQEFSDGYKKMPDTVCGIATNKRQFGGLYQMKKDLHSKLPGSPTNFLTCLQADKKYLDTKWYVEQIERNIF